MDINKISNRTIFRVLAMILGFVGLVTVAWLLREQLTWIIVAAFLAIALNPAVVWLSRYMPKKSRTWASLAVFLVVIILLGFILSSLVPPLISQTRDFIQNVPNYIDKIRSTPGPVGDFIRQHELVEKFRMEAVRLVNDAGTTGASVFKFVTGLFGGFISLITILVLTFLMLREGPGFVERFWRLHPAKSKERNQLVVNRMYKSVTGYVIGNVVTSLVCATVVGIFMFALGVPYAIPIALLVGLLDLLPLVGATLGAIIAVSVAFLTAFSSGVIMFIFFAIYQQFENTILQPYVYGKTIQMSPLVVFIAAILGAAIAGIVGALISVPLAASLTILAREYVKRRTIRE